MIFAILYILGAITAAHLVFFLASKDVSVGERIALVALWPLVAVFLVVGFPIQTYYEKILVPARAKAEKAKWDKKNKEALSRRSS